MTDADLCPTVSPTRKVLEHLSQICYNISCPEEPRLPRTVLHRHLDLWTGRGDVTAHRRRFRHDEGSCETQCPHCGYDNTPAHPVFRVCGYTLAYLALRWRTEAATT